MNQQVKTVASLRECVDGHAKLRTKQRSQEPSQPRGQPPATSLRIKQRAQEPSQPRGQPPAMSPTRVSRVTWGPSQVVRIPQRIDKGLETIRGNLEISHNFNIISELNVISAIQCREYCFSINSHNHRRGGNGVLHREIGERAVRIASAL